MHKYDWSNVDSRLSFLATDCDGLVYGFTHKPKLTDWGFAPTNGFSKQVYGACCGFGFNKEWRESLEERPKEPVMSEFKEFNHEFNKHHAYHGAYSEDYKRGARWGYQHQQAKVEGLQKQLNEYIFVAETIDEMYVKEVQKSDELQKRVDKAIRLLVEAELYQSEPNIDLAVKALKGEG